LRTPRGRARKRPSARGLAPCENPRAPDLYEIPIRRAAAPSRKYTSIGAISRGFARASPRGDLLGDVSMLDLILLALVIALFALSVGYAYVCERL